MFDGIIVVGIVANVGLGAAFAAASRSITARVERGSVSGTHAGQRSEFCESQPLSLEQKHNTHCLIC
jgi:hypothetical protein